MPKGPEVKEVLTSGACIHPHLRVSTSLNLAPWVPVGHKVRKTGVETFVMKVITGSHNKLAK